MGDFLAVYNRGTPGDAALRGLFEDRWGQYMTHWQSVFCCCRWAANGGERRGFRVEDFRMAGLTEVSEV